MKKSTKAAHSLPAAHHQEANPVHIGPKRMLQIGSTDSAEKADALYFLMFFNQLTYFSGNAQGACVHKLGAHRPNYAPGKCNRCTSRPGTEIGQEPSPDR